MNMGFKSSFQKFKKHEKLTRKEAMEAQCFECNGETAEQKDDCLGKDICPLYTYSPWGEKSCPTAPDCMKTTTTKIKRRRNEHGNQRI